MAYNTGNAIGSTDARDLYDNAQNLDKAMNSTDPTWIDRFGVARPTFKGVESELNQKVGDAEAAATQALGYLNTMRATSYGPLAEDPTTDPLGNPCTAGDEYFNTTYNLLKRFDGSIWRVPDINTENLASGAGSSMVGHGGQTVEAALDARLPEIGTYALLRAYTGPVTAFFVRGVENILDGGAGVFRVDAGDTTTADNGGTVLVDASGRRWKREFSGAVNVRWFGVSPSAPNSQNTIAIQRIADDYSINVAHFPDFVTISGSITIDRADLAFFGEGSGSSGIASSDATFWPIKLSGNAHRFSLRHMHVKGAAANDSTTQYCLGYANSDADAPEDCVIEYCRFSHANNGIVTGSGKRWSVSSNLFDTLVGVTSGRGYGILAAGNTSDCIFDKNKFLGSSGYGRHAVYMAAGASNCTASNNILMGFSQSALVSRAQSGQPGAVGNIITGNTILNGGTSATAESGAIALNGIVKNNLVSNNTIINFDNIGIAITDSGAGGLCESNCITGNHVIGAGLTGILVAGAKKTSVVNNVVHGASRLSSGVSRGIMVQSSGSWGTTLCEDTVVSSNVVTGSTHRCALTLNPGSPVLAPVGTVVTGNVFKAGATAGKVVELNKSSVNSVYVWNSDESTYANDTNDGVVDSASRCRLLDFGTVAANATKEVNVDVSGVATTGWTAFASPESVPVTGITWSAYISAANVVTIRVSNCTSSSVSLGQMNWRVDAFKHLGGAS